ncbi:MAG: aldo/keto reductase [Bacilli bacterium]|nr:aldo/keto reductase [Bacilli bacterium]
MEYRSLDKLNIKTSLLGFGCMRFPVNENGSINEELAEKMIDKTIASGVNYIDTAYPYHNGASEPFVGKVLAKYPRESYFLATKLPMWEVNKAEDVEEIFDKQLVRLNKEYVDFYLLHSMNKGAFDKVKEFKIVEILEKLRKEGKIRYIGFSFHDSYEVFEELVNYYNWDFCQIQLNYVDTLEQAGLKGYKLTEEKGIPLVIMEPIKGGTLATLPEDVSSIFKDTLPDKSIASWALRWVGSLPNVKVILSGMSTYDQVVDNLDTFSNFKALNEAEYACVEKVVEVLNERTKNGCTNCKYCMPCPAGVDIPGNFWLWNNYYKYNSLSYVGYKYASIQRNNALADVCVKCGKCENMCPQKIEIRKDLERVVVDVISKMRKDK